MPKRGNQKQQKGAVKSIYAKVFQQVFDSSIAENHLTRLVFTDLLTLADLNGVVDMTHEAIARRTNVPLDTVKAAIAELESPDPKSRTPVKDGRRLIRLDAHRDWGWLIVNYDRFREIASEEQRRAATLKRVHKHRGKRMKRGVTLCNASVTQGNAAVTPVNACNAMQKQKQKHKEMQIQKQMDNKEEGEPVFSTFNRSSDTLLVAYGRKPGERLNHDEERDLFELIKASNGTFESQLAEVLELRERTPAEERKYLPKSIGALLRKFSETLDQARAKKTTGREHVKTIEQYKAERGIK